MHAHVRFPGARALPFVLAFLLVPWFLGAQCVVNVSTGFDQAAGVVLTPGDPDDDYTVDAGAGPQPALTGSAAQGFPVPPWVENSSTSLWISNAANSSADPGNYTYEIRFDLAAGDSPAALTLVGSFTADDQISDVVVNGTSTGITAAGFNVLNAFPVGAGSGLFQEGENVLQFIVVNGGAAPNPAGLRVDACVGLVTAEDREIDISTGFDEDALLVIPNAAPDDDYTVTGPAGSGIGPAPATVVNDNAFPIPPWLGSSVQSKWISVQADSNGPGGAYMYSIGVEIGPDADASLSVIQGGFASDDLVADVVVNGTSTGITAGGFGGLTPFPPAAGLGLFTQGANTIEFLVENGSDGPTGLRVDAEVTVCPLVEIPVTPSPLSLDSGNAAGALIPNGAPDDSYEVVGPPGSGVCRAQAVVINDNAFPIPPWLGTSARSKWIGIQADSNGPPGTYTFRIGVSVPAALDAALLSLTGGWSSDNAGLDVIVNGSSLGFTTDGNFTILHAFPAGAAVGLFQSGDNRVEFLLDNAPPGINPVGLRVEARLEASEGRIAGDCNGDGDRNIADVICTILLQFPGFVLTGGPAAPPCGGDLGSPGNQVILDLNGDGRFDLADTVSLARFLFSSGRPPVLPGCLPVLDCPGGACN